MLDKTVTVRYNMYERGWLIVMTANEMLAEKIFRMTHLTTRSELLSAIEYELKQTEGHLHAATEAEAPFSQAKSKLLWAFSEKVHATPLFEKLDMGWSYVFTIGSRGATLHLRHWEHVAAIEFDAGEIDLDIGECDAFFDLIKTEVRLLTSDEYAKRCGVSGDTIRMWIRRGKIRSAVKLGNSWKIPEIAEPATRGFKDASYEWHTRIEDTPEGCRFLSDPGSLHIRRMRSRELPFQVTLMDSSGVPIDEQNLTSAEAEKLEAYLIATPEVIYTGDLEYFDKRKEES